MKSKQTTSRFSLLMRFLSPSAGLFIMSFLSSSLVTISESTVVQSIRLTVDSIIGSDPVELAPIIDAAFQKYGLVEFLRQNFHVIFIFVAAVALVGALFKYLARVCNSRGSEAFVKRLRDELFSHIQNLPFSWHTKHQTGDIIQRCTSDVETLRAFVSEQLVELFRVIFVIVFSTCVMFTMNVKLACIAAAFIPVVFSYSTYFRLRITDRFIKADESEGVLSTIAQENLTGVRVVRAFGRESFERDKFEAQNEIFTNLWAKLGVTMSWFWSVGDFVGYIQVLIVIVVGAVEAVNGNITLGDFIAFISFNTLIIWPVRSLGRIISEMSKAGVSLDRLGYILSSEAECDRPDARPADMHGDIEFCNVRFDYDGAAEVLRGVSFKVESGTTFGILGSTGSGKSTLMHLLNRLYDLPPENGKITVGGVDIADMPSRWVRQNVGMVLQEPFLFSRSVSDNISLAGGNMTLSDIRAAARIACIDDEILEFDDGYDTVVGERGVTLSGGQKQRVAIARMLASGTPIMVFDDSLSAVDTQTDAKIQAALGDKLAGSTVIIISHRITTLMRADKIMVLDDGRIAQMGTHEELIAHDGIYKRIYDMQMSHGGEAEI